MHRYTTTAEEDWPELAKVAAEGTDPRGRREVREMLAEINEHRFPRQYLIASGQVYEWRGLPGQYENDNRIQIDSMTASCGVNASIVDELGAVCGLCTIPAADLLAAIGAGWLVLIGGGA